MTTPLPPQDLLTPIGTAITRTSSWWTGLLDCYDDATDTDSAGLPLYDPETVAVAMGRVALALGRVAADVDAAPHGPGGTQSPVTVVFTARELDEVFPLGVPT